MKTWSVTKASKSSRECVNRVYTRNTWRETFAIVKLGVPYALLVPASTMGCKSHDLGDDLADADLPAAGAAGSRGGGAQGPKGAQVSEEPVGLIQQLQAGYLVNARVRNRPGSSGNRRAHLPGVASAERQAPQGIRLPPATTPYCLMRKKAWVLETEVW
jgi:hypothetical protein